MRHRIVIGTGVLWFLIDLITKRWAENAGISYKNTGIAFGINLPLWLQIGVSVLLIGAIIKWFVLQPASYKLPPLLNSIILGIILGGALGNLVSRIRFGYVVDFIRLGPIPTFNIADAGITVGIVLLVLSGLTERHNH